MEPQMVVCAQTAVNAAMEGFACLPTAHVHQPRQPAALALSCRFVCLRLLWRGDNIGGFVQA